MVLSHGQHVRVEIDVAAARARHREREADHVGTREGTHDLASDFIGDHEHAERDQFGVGKVPDFFLEGNASAKIFDAVAVAKFDGVGAHAVFSPG
jgi:hypothetical protein